MAAERPRCTNRVNKNSDCNNISSTLVTIDDVIITISRYIGNPDIVGTVYSGIFRHIQGHSAVFSHFVRHIEGC